MTIYEICVKNWAEHNPDKKKNHKKTLISNNLISDSKVLAMPISCRWLYLALLLICGDQAKDTITMTERQLNELLTTKEGASNALDRMQSLQLLSYQKEKILYKRIVTEEKNNRRNNLREVDLSSNSDPISKPEFPIKKIKKEPDIGISERREIKQAYVDAYRLRYGIDPASDNKNFNSLIKSLQSKFGKAESIGIIQFYLKHDDSFYLKATHSLNLCILHSDTLRTQMLRGKPITQIDIRRYEKAKSVNDMLEEAKKGGF